MVSTPAPDQPDRWKVSPQHLVTLDWGSLGRSSVLRANLRKAAGGTWVADSESKLPVGKVGFAQHQAHSWSSLHILEGPLKVFS